MSTGVLADDAKDQPDESRGSPTAIGPVGLALQQRVPGEEPEAMLRKLDAADQPACRRRAHRAGPLPDDPRPWRPRPDAAEHRRCLAAPASEGNRNLELSAAALDTELQRTQAHQRLTAALRRIDEHGRGVARKPPRSWAGEPAPRRSERRHGHRTIPQLGESPAGRQLGRKVRTRGDLSLPRVRLPEGGPGHKRSGEQSDEDKPTHAWFYGYVRWRGPAWLRPRWRLRSR
jgi:hypothetical protein